MVAVYRRREPEHTVLWQCVHDHLPAFLAKAAETDRAVPEFVKKELTGFLECGILENGFARVVCGDCGFTRLVPFSCKGRGACPSCVARRMAEISAHLADHVFPHVPVRQWVLSLPTPLRYLLAWDSELLAKVVGIFVNTVFRHLTSQAKREGIVIRRADAHPGGVCVVQRWGSSINLNPHMHSLIADGVFVTKEDGSVEFRALPEPSQAEIADVAWTVCKRVIALLRKRGQWLDAAPEDDRLADTEPLLAQLYSASIAGTLVMGPRAGQRQMRLFGAAARSEAERKPPKNAYGFDVDASVRVPGYDHKRLEMLARYMLRPPLSKDRLVRQSDGRYRVTLKKAWHDGTTHIVLDGPELVGRLAALVPPPRVHLTRYFGVFAPRAKLRRRIVPKCDDASCACSHDGNNNSPANADTPTALQRRYSWAKLLARVFSIDVLECPKCQSKMQAVEWCLRPERIQAVLNSTGPPSHDGQPQRTTVKFQSGSATFDGASP